MAIWNETSISNLGRYATLSADYYMPEYSNVEAKLKTISDQVVPLKRVANPRHPITYGVLKPREVSESNCRLARIQNSENLFIFGSDLPSISDNQFEEYRRSEVRKGDIIIAIGGYIGPLGIISDNEELRININRHLARVSPDATRLDPYYLTAYLASTISQTLLRREIRGAVQAGVNIADLKLHPIFLPCDLEQNSIDDLVRKAEQQRIESRDAYTQAQQLLESELGLDKLRFDKTVGYTERFSVVGLADSVNANRIDAQCFSPEAVFYEDWLLKHANCDRLSLLLASTAKGRQQAEVETGTTDYCSIKHITGREIVGASKANPSAGTSTARKDDLLLAITGATIGKIGVVNRYDNLVFSGDILRLRANGSVSPHYLLLTLDHHLGQVQFNRWITGSTNGHLAPRDVGRILVPRLAPEIEKQIVALMAESLEKRQESEQLLDQAKYRVEQLIEEVVRV
ncbi:MAG: hypothetical protein AB7S77_05520 [Desulfatirhabdiaceae bacterium]